MKTHITREKGSITLGMVYGLGLLSLGVASLALSSVVTNLSTHKNEMSGVRTFVTADSAAREGAYRFIEYGMSEVGTIDLNSVLGSETSIIVSNYPIRHIRGVASTTRTERKMVYEVQPSDIQSGFEHAIFAQQNLEISGAASTTGSVYVGNDLKVTGAGGQGGANTPKVSGSIYVAGDIATNTNHDFGEVHNHNVAVLSAPTIDKNHYVGLASEYCSFTLVSNQGQGGGQGGGNTVQLPQSFQWNNCKNEVVHIQVEAGKTVNGHWPPQGWSGVVVIDGNATMNGGRFSCADDCEDPLAIYVDGNLSLSGTVQVKGLVYVTGIATVGSGSGSVDGSLVSSDTGGVKVTGALSVSYNKEIMGSWENIGGLDTSGGTDPIFRTAYQQ